MHVLSVDTVDTLTLAHTVPDGSRWHRLGVNTSHLHVCYNMHPEKRLCTFVRWGRACFTKDGYVAGRCRKERSYL